LAFFGKNEKKIKVLFKKNGDVEFIHTVVDAS
jgi:hypothetical protein